VTGVHWLGLEEDIAGRGAELLNAFAHRVAEHRLLQNASPACVTCIPLLSGGNGKSATANLMSS
jgi:hypothetical protein